VGSGIGLEYQLTFSTTGVDWQTAASIFEKTELGVREAARLEQAFESSTLVCFAWNGEKLIGMGRALSDGVYQSVIYDLCILPEYQDNGLGRTMMQEILARLKTPSVILWSVPGKEGFYTKLGFHTMRTAMARFEHPEVSAQKGYIKL
tara:strand:+ start:359 stop:802 length:444 start_codon:yes stop_codon:yes gene_type:complete